MPTALITGASAGLGLALATGLADRNWTLIVTARGTHRLHEAATHLATRTGVTHVTAVPGDVADPTHRHRLADTVARLGPLDLLVHNASTLGPSPLRTLDRIHPEEFAAVLDINVVSPTALTAALLPALSPTATVVAISSDAAVEHYEGWGAYGAAKAALDHTMATLAAECPGIAWYAVDPGDMRTEMHQAAFPGEDISDRPEPATVVPALLNLLDRRPPSGRYRAAEFAPVAGSRR